jgi:transposase
MQAVACVGIDLSKSVFQLHGVDRHGHAVLRRRLRRGELAAFMARLPGCVVGLEACGGAHYWARVFGGQGHTVRLIAPQFVKPYVKGNKNDLNDAEAICEAVSRPHMRFVPSKSIEQQDVQALHRVRSRLIGARTALVNQIRGLLAEYGIVLPKSIGQVRRGLPGVIEDAQAELSVAGRQLFRSLYEHLADLDRRVTELDDEVQRLYRSNPVCQRVAAVEGVGPLVATAIVSAIGDGRAFKNGRQLSAWLGLVPKQDSSGGRTRLLGISKRGDPYLRTLLVHGARSVVYRSKAKTDSRSQWIADKQRRLGTNRACVALANKNARIIWSLVANDCTYRRAA